MNKPVSAKCYSSIMRDLARISLILRRLRKYNCKSRGGVVRNVSRGERHFANTFTPITSPSPAILSQRPSQHQEFHEEKKSARKKVLQAFSKSILRNLFGPPPPHYFSPDTDPPKSALRPATLTSAYPNTRLCRDWRHRLENSRLTPNLCHVLHHPIQLSHIDPIIIMPTITLTIILVRKGLSLNGSIVQPNISEIRQNTYPRQRR